MSEIRPFKGLRPTAESAPRVASLPYDVLSSDEARTLVKNNPASFLRVNKPEVDFEPGVEIYSDKIYTRGKENLNQLISDGLLVRDDSDCFYLYRLSWQGNSQTGLVCLTSVDEYNAGKIKKHEHTRPQKVSDRADHIMTLQAQVGPVFSIFRYNQKILDTFTAITSSSPLIDFTADDEVHHQFWKIADEKMIDSLISGFASLDAIYIADGHHRSEAAAEVCRRERASKPDYSGDESFNYYLNVIFPDNELHILPYNRLVGDLNSLSLEQLLEKAKDSFEINPLPSSLSPGTAHHIGMYCEKKWYELIAKNNTFNINCSADTIDAAILYENMLRPILGIQDIRTDNRIDFVGGIRGVEELVRQVDSMRWQIAFSLPPVTVEQLLDVADAGEVMPPKSTWFEPKLRSGMAVNILD